MLAAEVPEDGRGLVEALSILQDQDWNLTSWALVASLERLPRLSGHAPVLKLNLCVSHQKSRSFAAGSEIKVH